MTVSASKKYLWNYISIHIPREGDDERTLAAALAAGAISIHIPREGDDYKS